MSAEDREITTVENWRARTLFIGGLVGAMVGVAAAYLLVQRSSEDHPPKFSVGEGVKVGALVLGLLRSIANI